MPIHTRNAFFAFYMKQKGKRKGYVPVENIEKMQVIKNYN